MIFTPPSWLADQEPHWPDDLTAGNFVLNYECPYLEQAKRKNPLLCAESSQSVSQAQLRESVELLSQGLCARFGWTPHAADPWERIVAICSPNNVRRPTISLEKS